MREQLNAPEGSPHQKSQLEPNEKKFLREACDVSTKAPEVVGRDICSGSIVLLRLALKPHQD